MTYRKLAGGRNAERTATFGVSRARKRKAITEGSETRAHSPLHPSSAGGLRGPGALKKMPKDLAKSLMGVLFVCAGPLFATSGIGCGGSAASDTSGMNADAVSASADSYKEAQDDGTTAWVVKPDGNVAVVVKSGDGSTPEGTTGTLDWNGTKVPLTYDKNRKVLTGAGPALTADVTEVKYTVTVSGKPWTGSLFLPAGGTAELAKNATESSQKPPTKTTGPNGGVVQVVGDDTVEIVSDKSGQVRVYVLGPDSKPIAIGDRKIKLGMVGAGSETIVLNGGPGGTYFVGQSVTKVDPVKITVVVTTGGKTRVVQVGYAPTTVVVVGNKAPKTKVVVVNDWTTVTTATTTTVVHGDDDDHDHGKGHGHGHGKGKKK